MALHVINTALFPLDADLILAGGCKVPNLVSLPRINIHVRSRWYSEALVVRTDVPAVQCYKRSYQNV